MVDQLEDLDEQEARIRRHLESAVADLLAVFRTDLGTFVEREVRNRFVAHEGFAESLEDDKLRRLKDRTKEVGETVAKEVCDELSGNMDFWFGPQVPLGEGKTFDAHKALMDKLQGAATAAAQLLQEFQFPADPGGGYKLSYTPPAYFVNGKYAPGLAETFWKYFAQLHEIREARREQDVGRRRALQRHRWDQVDPKKQPT